MVTSPIYGSDIGGLKNESSELKIFMVSKMLLKWIKGPP